MNTDKNGLPSIRHVLGDNRINIRFVKPTLGDGITNLYTEETTDSPATTILAIRKVTIGGLEAIPFHRHNAKEKLCTLEKGWLTFFLFIGSHVEAYNLSSPGEQIVIPAGIPHAVYGRPLGENATSNEMIVIASSQDPQVDWEEGIEELLLNKHLD